MCPNGLLNDTVQVPLNPLNPNFRSLESNVLPVAGARGIAVLGMKSMGSGVILKSETVTPVECLHYALNLPTSVVITGIDSMKILEQDLKAVKSFEPLTDKQVAALLARTAKAAAGGKYERFKTTNGFDGTAKNPKWLGEPDQGPG